MFVLFEKEGTRYAYDLHDKVRFESVNGNISVVVIEERELFHNVPSGKQGDDSMKFVRGDDLSSLYYWLNGIDWGFIAHQQTLQAENQAKSQISILQSAIEQAIRDSGAKIS